MDNRHLKIIKKQTNIMETRMNCVGLYMPVTDLKVAISDSLLTKDLLLSIYKAKGLNGLNAALKTTPHITKVIEFGLATNKKAIKDKADFLSAPLPYNVIRVHYYSVQRGKRFRYNVLRAKQIEL